jgi:hypothetical protein
MRAMRVTRASVSPTGPRLPTRSGDVSNPISRSVRPTPSRPLSIASSRNAPSSCLARLALASASGLSVFSPSSRYCRTAARVLVTPARRHHAAHGVVCLDDLGKRAHRPVLAGHDGERHHRNLCRVDDRVGGRCQIVVERHRQQIAHQLVRILVVPHTVEPVFELGDVAVALPGLGIIQRIRLHRLHLLQGFVGLRQGLLAGVVAGEGVVVGMQHPHHVGRCAPHLA